jgi:hypothetical protein
MNRDLLDHRRNFAKHPDEVVAPTVGEVYCGDMDKFTAIQKVIGACQRDYRQTLKELRILVAQGHALRTESATDIPVCRPATDNPFPEPEQTESPVGQAFPPANSDTMVPEPQQSKTTSESSASFPNNPPAPFRPTLKPRQSPS